MTLYVAGKDEMKLTKISETNRAITIGWPFVQDQYGYVPTIDGSEKLTDGKRHEGLSKTLRQVTIGKPQGETTPFSKHTYGVNILILEDDMRLELAGSLIPPVVPPVIPPPVITPPTDPTDPSPDPPPVDVLVHRHRLTVFPGGHDLDSNGGNNHYDSVWGKFRSPTTLYVNDGNPRTIAWGSGQLYAGRKAFVIFPFFPEIGQNADVILNFHNHPNFGGWEPDNSTGVSPILVRLEGNNGITLTLQAEGARSGNYSRRWTFATKAEVDAARNGGELKLRLDIDIGTYPNGKVIGYVNGVQKFDTGAVSTHWPSQTAYSVWEGIYNSSGLTTKEQHSYEPAKIGRTFVEAQADVDIEEAIVMGTVYISDGTPNWTHQTL